MINEHQTIIKETEKAIKLIKGLAMKHDADAMRLIVNVAKEWDKLYGNYFETLEYAQQLDTAKVFTKKAKPCKQCKDRTEKTLPGQGPHRLKVVCGRGHFKRWC